MVIEKIKISDLKPTRYNPRINLKPKDPEYEKLNRSIETFGYSELIVWNKRTGNIVSGHQRLKVLIELGYTEIECNIIDESEEREKALNGVMNKIGGKWD
jgi:ParB-like chromosome segregation protein Spo0J